MENGPDGKRQSGVRPQENTRYTGRQKTGHIRSRENSIFMALLSRRRRRLMAVRQAVLYARSWA